MKSLQTALVRTAVVTLLASGAAAVGGETARHIAIAGDVRMPGVYEVRDGITVRDVVRTVGATDESVRPRLVRKNVTSFVEDLSAEVKDEDVLLVDPVRHSEGKTVVVVPRGGRPIMLNVSNRFATFERMILMLGLAGPDDVFVATGPVLPEVAGPMRDGDVLHVGPLGTRIREQLEAHYPVVAVLATRPGAGNRAAMTPQPPETADDEPAPLPAPRLSVAASPMSSAGSAPTQTASLSKDHPVGSDQPFVGVVPISNGPAVPDEPLLPPTPAPPMEIPSALPIAELPELPPIDGSAFGESGSADQSASVANGPLTLPTMDEFSPAPAVAESDEMAESAFSQRPVTDLSNPSMYDGPVATESASTELPSIQPALTVSDAVSFNTGTNGSEPADGGGFEDFAMIAADALAEESSDGSGLSLTQWLGLGFAVVLLVGGLSVLGGTWISVAKSNRTEAAPALEAPPVAAAAVPPAQTELPAAPVSPTPAEADDEVAQNVQYAPETVPPRQPAATPVATATPPARSAAAATPKSVRRAYRPADILRMPSVDESGPVAAPPTILGEPIGGKRLRIDAPEPVARGPHFGRRGTRSDGESDDVLARALQIMKQENVRRAA